MAGAMAASNFAVLSDELSDVLRGWRISVGSTGSGMVMAKYRVANAATTTTAGPAMTSQTMPNDHQALGSEVLGFAALMFVSLLEFMRYFP